MITFPICLSCKHFYPPPIIRGKRTCAAFPDGIPEEVYPDGRADHRTPREGDNGIQFELDEADEAEVYLYQVSWAGKPVGYHVPPREPKTSARPLAD